MREILFRGKRKDNGEWVEGAGINTQYDVNGKKRMYIGEWFSVERTPLMKNISWYEVIPETVGQYTGLRDCQHTEEYPEGRMIFDGDILSYIDNDGDVQYISVVFEECAFLIEESGITDSDLLPSYVCLGLTVAGNIHDTPELLEVHNA